MSEVLPERMELKPSRLKWLLVFLIGALFSSAPIWAMADKHPLIRWGTCGFFLLVALVALPGVIGVGSRLELDREGFTCTALFRSWRRTWADCSEFTPTKIGLNSFVGFSTATDEINHPALSAAARTMAGTAGALPDNYGMPVRDLAELMNRFRARALAGNYPPSGA